MAGRWQHDPMTLDQAERSGKEVRYCIGIRGRTYRYENYVLAARVASAIFERTGVLVGIWTETR